MQGRSKEKRMELERLKEPFPAADIEWRLQQCGEKNGKLWGKCLAYVTNRAIMNRLDDVCGAENWKNEFVKAPDGGVLCGISVRVGDEFVTKWDGAENTDIEGVKGGLSGAMKRAAVHWGIGRYLYYLDEGWADVSENGAFTGKTKDGKFFRWNPPKLPSWALPGGAGKPEAKEQPKKSPDRSTVPTAGEDARRCRDVIIDYINAGVLTGEFARKAEMYMDANDIAGMNNVIAWCRDHAA